MITNTLIIFDLQGTLVKTMRPPVLNGSISTLKKLAKTNTLAIFTGAPRTETLNILRKLKISNFFKLENIITSGRFPKKPSPEAIFWLKTNNKATNILYLGDTKKDYKTAKNANVPFIYFGKQKNGVIQVTTFDELDEN